MRWSNKCPGSAIIDAAADQGYRDKDRVTNARWKYGVLPLCRCQYPWWLSVLPTIALTNVTLPYIEALAGKGFAQCYCWRWGLASRCDHHQGYLTSLPVAQGLDKDHTSIDELVNNNQSLNQKEQFHLNPSFFAILSLPFSSFLTGAGSSKLEERQPMANYILAENEQSRFGEYSWAFLEHQSNGLKTWAGQSDWYPHWQSSLN